MSLATNCKKCNNMFMKMSMKSVEIYCISCKMTAGGKGSTNTRVKSALNEKSKEQIITLLEDMIEKQNQFERHLGELESKLESLETPTVTQILDVIGEEIVETRIKSIVRAKVAGVTHVVRQKVDGMYTLINDNLYWKGMVKQIMKEIEEEE